MRTGRVVVSAVSHDGIIGKQSGETTVIERSYRGTERGTVSDESFPPHPNDPLHKIDGASFAYQTV